MADRDEQLRESMTRAGLDANASFRPGFSGMGNIGAVYTPTSGVALGDSGKQPGYTVQPAENENTYRVGDYTWTGSGYGLVNNSPTDVFQRYVTSDAEPLEGLSLTDWFNAASKGLMAWNGLPTNDPSENVGEDVLKMATTTGVGQIMKGTSLTRGLWAGANVLESINDANRRALDEYMNQDFNYDLAGEFVTDDDGKTTFRPDYSKMADAGPESGSAVKSAQNTEATSVKMDSDNNLTIQVSPAFAESDTYKSLTNTLKDKFNGLTLDDANEVVDNDTGTTRLQNIESLVKSAESNYLYNIQTVKQVKEKAPTASDESINDGVEVSKVGYITSEDTLAETSIKIYNDNNELVDTSAKDWLDSVKNMDKVGRENYMLSLGNRIADPNISDDEKAVLYGQSIALYAASDTDGAYNGIYQKDFFDAVGSASGIFTGLPLNSFFGGTELTTFRDDELSSGLLTLGGTFLGVKALTGVTNLTEKGLRKVTPKISEWSGHSLSEAMRGSDDASATLRSIIGKTATQIGYQVAADAMYDASKLVPYALTGNIENSTFWKELSTDFVMDMLATYGPGQFAGAMASPKYERRILVEDTKTGEFVYKHPKDIKLGIDGKDYKILEDETGTRDVQMVAVTADELASRRAASIDKMTDSKLGLKVQELIFDKNAALTKLAVQIRRTSDAYHYRKFMRQANDIRQLTQDAVDAYMAKENVKKHWDDLKTAMKENGGERVKDFSKADWDYIKAVTNEHRFLGKQEGDKKAEKIVRDFYKEGKNGVSPERAKQLDKIMKAMRVVANDVLDHYVEKGLLSQEDADSLRSAPGYEDNKYLPMYMKDKILGGGPIGQDRVMFKKVRDPNALIKLKDIDNPLSSLSRYVNNAMRAVAVNDRALAIRDAANIAGTKITVTSDSGGSLSDFKELKSLSDEFGKIFKGIAAKTRKELPSFRQWQEANDKLVTRSAAYKSAEKLGKLQEEGKELRRQLRNERRRKVKPIVSMATDKDYPGWDVEARNDGNMGLLSMLDESNPKATNEGTKRDYYRDWKGKELRVIEVSPSEYGKLMAKDSQGRSLSDGEKAASGYYIDKFENGEKVALPSIQYDKNGKIIGQEGRHRSYAAESVGIDKMPVIIEYPKGSSAKWLDKYKDVTEKFVIRQQPGEEKKAQKISELQSKIQENKQQQLKTTDDIKRYIGLVMKRAQKDHKGSDTKLDLNSYLNVEVTAALKSALKSGNMVGEVQKVINRAVESANPWIDPDIVIRERASGAAVKYRKTVENRMKNQKKTLGDKFNLAVDKAMDKILQKVTGEKDAEVTYIDEDGEPTTFLSNHGQKNTIRYRLNGEVYEMKLSGTGAEELVSEFYAPEFVAPKTTIGKVAHRVNNVARRLAQLKRYLTTSADVTRALPNLARDWSRGIVSTGGQIMISPEKFFDELSTQYGYSEEQTKQIQNGLMLARRSVDRSTLTESLIMPSKNRAKTMVRAMNEPDGNAFTKYAYYAKTGQINKLLSAPQDIVETFTRRRAMDTAYYKELADAQSRGLSMDESIKRATEAAYFYGREATVNFFRRGTLISKIAQYTPYLSQRFATLESFKATYLDNPIAVTRALESTVSAYATLIAIALSNEESRKKYYMLTEYDRANNIIIPIDNSAIMTIPLDETIAAFLTPYRRMIETLNGVDPEAFYLCFAEGLEALSPVDLSGFSEGDAFNIRRGFEKIGAEFIPTWAQPFVEMATGRDLFYGSSIEIDSDYTGARYGNWTPTPGELTTKGKNSQLLKSVADNTGIPQWILQNFVSEYGGNLGQYLLNTIDKTSGATEDAQGGKEWSDSIFKPFTGSDSDQVSNAFYQAIDVLKEDKEKVQKEIATLSQQIKGAAYNERAELIRKRQEKIDAYGLRVTDVLNQYLSAYEITGGLSKSQANQAWYLYKLYDDNFNANMYLEDSVGGYYTDKASSYSSKQATSLAARSGLDSVVKDPTKDYMDTYAGQALKNTVYGYGLTQMAELANILEDTSDYNNSFTKLRSDIKQARYAANQRKDYTTASQLAYTYDTQIANAIYPYLVQHGVAETLDNSTVMNYLKDWFIVPSEEQKTAKGKYAPNLGVDSEKEQAFKKQFIKKIFGVSGK